LLRVGKNLTGTPKASWEKSLKRKKLADHQEGVERQKRAGSREGKYLSEGGGGFSPPPKRRQGPRKPRGSQAPSAVPLKLDTGRSSAVKQEGFSNHGRIPKRTVKWKKKKVTAIGESGGSSKECSGMKRGIALIDRAE